MNGLAVEIGSGKYWIARGCPQWHPLRRVKETEPQHTFTVYTKDASCGRGEYAEEIDVLCHRRSATEAKKVAAAALECDYEPGLRPVRAVERFGLYW